YILAAWEPYTVAPALFGMGPFLLDGRQPWRNLIDMCPRGLDAHKAIKDEPEVSTALAPIVIRRWRLFKERSIALRCKLGCFLLHDFPVRLVVGILAERIGQTVHACAEGTFRLPSTEVGA